MPNNQVTNEIEAVEIEASAIGGNGGAFGQLSKAEKETRIRQRFAESKVILSLGSLLSVKAKDGNTLAAHIASGANIPVPKVRLADGSVIAPKNVQSLSLENVKTWGCPSCQSAHGTGVGASHGAVSEKGLRANRWYYAVDSQTLFVISDTCFDSYVGGSGLKAQIKTPAQMAEQTPKNGAKKSA
jgi:hypothetical protein